MYNQRAKKREFVFDHELSFLFGANTFVLEFRTQMCAS